MVTSKRGAEQFMRKTTKLLFYTAVVILITGFSVFPYLCIAATILEPINLEKIKEKKYKMLCGTADSSVNIFFFSDSVGSTLDQIYCDLNVFYWWDRGELSLNFGQSEFSSVFPKNQETAWQRLSATASITASDNPEYQKVTDKKNIENQIANKKKISFSPFYSRQSERIVFFGYGGINWKWIAFTDDNRIRLRTYEPSQGSDPDEPDSDQDFVTRDSIDFRLFGFGIKLCPIWIESGGITLGGCYVPSMGWVSQQITGVGSRSFILPFESYFSQVSFGWKRFSVYLGITSHFFSDVKDSNIWGNIKLFPDDCNNGSCPDKLFIFSRDLGFKWLF